MRRRVSAALLVTALSGALALSLASPPSAQALACGDVQARSTTFIVGGGGVGCRFMRRWAGRYLSTRDEPRGWNCHYRGASGGCDKRRSRAFFVFYPPD